MWSVSWCTLERVPGEDSFVFMWSVSWCTLERVPGEGLSCCLYVVCPLVHPEKGPRGRLVCLYVVCPLVLGCQGKACLSTCCLSPGVPKEAPREGMSVRFVTCGQVNAQEHKLTQTPNHNTPPPPPPFTIYFPCISVPPSTVFIYILCHTTTPYILSLL